MATIAVQEPAQAPPLGAIAGYGSSEDVSLEAEDTPTQVTPVKVYPASGSVPSINQSTSSLGGSKPIPPNRQADYEKLFGQQVPKPKGEAIPSDFLTVVQTQSADLQASLLLHGRLYLTRYHLCFRSNIVGYVTEKVHDLRDIISVERSTTAKWIQNAVSIGLDTTSDEKVLGYGSMADREAMYAGLMEVWKERAPERYNTYMDRVEREKAAAALADSGAAGATSSRHRSSTTATRSGTIKVPESTGRHRAATAAGELEHVETGRPVPGSITEEQEDEHVTEIGTGKETECSGEHFDEVALDTTLPVEMKQLFQLMYRTPEFGRDWLENKQKLTDVKVSEWEDKGGVKERSLTYVMHMNNYIGPKKSDCIGSERVEVEQPDEAYEIVSETQTPDVPSGKSFKIHTRTCLTHTVIGNVPSTRMYCTTQCNWSASSMLKSTITPAVIKGQKEYHQNWLAALKEWIDNHPEDFISQPAGGETPKASNSATLPDKAVVLPVKSVRSKPKVVEEPNVALDSQAIAAPSAQLTDITQNQPMMIILLVCLLSLALNVYLVSK